jgi:chromosome segregation ATPase
MSKPDAPRTQNAPDKPSRTTTNLTTTKRVDLAHVVASEAPGAPPAAKAPPAKNVPDEPVAEQLRLQADQLAAHLRARQKELDHREAELNSLAARLESDARAARLWLSERETEAAAAATEQKQAVAPLADADDVQKQRQREFEEREESLRSRTELLDARQRQFEEAEGRFAAAQSESQQIQEHLLTERRAMQEEAATTRRQMADEHDRAMAELQQKRDAVQRRSEHVDHCRAALTQLRGELGRMHRETLEVRLATEELWVQLSGAAPPAALTRSLGRIRARLAEYYRQSDAELAEQKQELEGIRGQLSEQHEKLVEQKGRFEHWAAAHQEEAEQQASRLVAREEQLRREESRLREQSHRWQTERTKYQQEIRRLRAELAAHEEAAVPV